MVCLSSKASTLVTNVSSAVGQPATTCRSLGNLWRASPLLLRIAASSDVTAATDSVDTDRLATGGTTGGATLSAAK